MVSYNNDPLVSLQLVYFRLSFPEELVLDNVPLFESTGFSTFGQYHPKWMPQNLTAKAEQIAHEKLISS